MFVIARHGNTFATGEPPRRIGARTDLPLTLAGVAQAEALGEHFAERGWRFARILTSPLLRTRDTAAAIAARLGGPEPKAAQFLREIDHGPDEDRPESEVVARIGAEALAAWDREGVVPPGWQVDAEMRLTAWRELLSAEQGPLLLVTSNGAARFALLAAGLAVPDMKLPTGGYGVIRHEGSGLAAPVWGVRP